MNGLQGRMLYMPATNNKSKEVLFIYGHHSTLESWWPLVQELNKFGAVTVPDLPGFGGMQSLYTIGESPTIDRFADYLAAFIKLRYKRRRLTVVGVGFGFVVATRMLQRYPDLAKKVDLIVSLAGLSHYDDFSLKPSKLKSYRLTAWALSFRLTAVLFRYTGLQTSILRSAYAARQKALKWYRAMEASVFVNEASANIELWHKCNVRTHMATIDAMLKMDNCQSRLSLPFWHVSVKPNQYLNAPRVEQHLQVIFEDFHQAQSKINTRKPISDVKTAAQLIPSKLRRQLVKA